MEVVLIQFFRYQASPSCFEIVLNDILGISRPEEGRSPWRISRARSCFGIHGLAGLCLGA